MPKESAADPLLADAVKIRVLFVAHDAQLHGAQFALLEILRNLDLTKYVPLVVAPQSGPFTDEVGRLGIKVTTGGVMRWIFRRDALSLRNLLHEPRLLFKVPAFTALFFLGFPIRVARLLAIIYRDNIDVVYTNTITILDAAVSAKIASRPHIWHLHEHIERNEGIRSVLPRKWVVQFIAPKLSSRMVMASNALLTTLFPNSRHRDKLHVIHNGVDTVRFSPGPGNNFLYQELGIPFDAPLIGIFGDIREDKGHEAFIKAAALVATQRPEARFLIVGEGLAHYRLKLANLAEHLGVNDKLHFMGWRSDMPEIYRELLAVVIASRNEAFGRTAIESMASAKPIVATRCGGPEEVVLDGETGYLIKTDDHSELAQKLVELITTPTLALSMGQAGRKRVLNHFSAGQIAAKTEALITCAAWHASS